LAEALAGQEDFAAAKIPASQALTLARQFGLGDMESRALRLLDQLGG
jgi:hypothetical protein